MSRAKPNVLFQLSGSIAAYKACHVISRLVQAGCDVQTVATSSALEFIGTATLEGLTGHRVATETFASGSYMDHIHLIRGADLVVLCPATANTINKLASGIGDDLVSTLFLAHDFKKPYLIAPAMNVAMYQHPSTQSSVRRLKDWGVEFLDPASGALACGEVGAGRLLEPDLILNALLTKLSLSPSLGTSHESRPPDRQLRILITSGGTKVPIDGVRSITNTSSGATGAVIAEYFARRGHDVTLLHSKDATLPQSPLRLEDGSQALIRKVSYSTFTDLESALVNRLREERFDVIIQMAAVSDYGLDGVISDGVELRARDSGKIESGETLTIRLKRNPKLLPRLKELSGNRSLIIGFKLTKGANSDDRRAAVAKVAAGCDLVVHNDADEISAAGHTATLYRDGIELSRASTKLELAKAIERAVFELIPETGLLKENLE